MAGYGVFLAGSARRGGAQAADRNAPDIQRRLRLGLATIWLLDAVLQYQPYMFTKAFGQTLAGTAQGNPQVIAGPITWSARIVSYHPTAINAAFATIQLLLALGLAWRPTVKITLAASVAWSLAVWWLGEGLGGVLAGNASPVNGAPGAVIMYALLAVLLWPAGRGARSSFAAGRPLGALPARLLWLVLWGSLAYLAVQATDTTSPGLHAMISASASGEPGWIASIDHGAAALLVHWDLTASVVLAVVLAVIAAGVFLPVPAARATVLLAVAAAGLIWVVGEDFGAIFTGSATDPNSGLLLALLAAAYWPARNAATAPSAVGTPAAWQAAAAPAVSRAVRQ